MKTDKYVKLEDILKIIPEDDKTGPKPSYLRKYLETISYITVMVIDPKDYPKSKEEELIELSL